MNINNNDYKKLKEKRDRAVKYWKDRVIQEFLPPIDTKKKNEIVDRVTKMKHVDNRMSQMGMNDKNQSCNKLDKISSS